MTNHFKTITILSMLMLVLLIIVSYYGVFVPGTYARETAAFAAEGIGQDFVNLFLVVPLLIVSLYLSKKGSRKAYIIFSGGISYILYSFIIYSFGLHFNNLFLLYCAILGLSIYIFILSLNDLSKSGFIKISGSDIPVRSIGTFLIIVSTLFYLLWLKEIIPAIINNTVPKSVSDYNILVNTVHIIDISFVLPGLIITAILLFKKHHLGYVLTLISLIFVLIMAIALIAMVVVTKINGISDDISVAIFFSLMALISFMFLIKFLKYIK